MSNNNKSNDGIGFIGMLLILFIGLKLANQITWAWWWVFSPMWIPIALLIVGALIYFVVMEWRRK